MKLSVLKCQQSILDGEAQPGKFLLNLGAHIKGIGEFKIGEKKASYWVTAGAEVPVGTELELDLNQFNQITKHKMKIINGVETEVTFIALEAK